MISVIVPIYNVEDYLPECLDSIVKQSFTDFEVILVDDGSTDNSSLIAQKYANSHDNWLYFRKENGGLSSARNFGLNLATRQYVVFVDSDDRLYPDYLKRLFDKTILNEADITICGYTEFCDDRILDFNLPCDEMDRVFKKNEIWEYFYSNPRTSIITAWSKIYRKTLFNTIKFTEGKLFEDELIAPALFDEANKIVCINEPLYFYRKNRLGSITSKKDLGEITRFEYIFKRARFFIEKNYCQDLQLLLSLKSLVLFTNNLKDAKQQVEISKDFEIISSFLKKNFSKLILKQKIRLLCPLLSYFSAKFMRTFRRIKKNRIEKKIKAKYFGGKWVVGTPSHGNLGDQAIAETTLNLLTDYLEIEFNYFNNYFEIFAKCNPSSIVMLGGGNLGNVYKEEEELRIKVISTFPCAKIVIFPQTMWFRSDDLSKYCSIYISQIYDSHNNLTLYAREKYSYLAMKKLFKKTVIKISPDTVLINKPIINKHKTNKKVLLIIRNDGETNQSEKECINLLLNKLTLRKYKFISADTCIKKAMNFKNRKKFIHKFFKKIQSVDFVITDRLHGMIFSFVNSTPFIAFTNYNHKIDGSFEWLEENPCLAINFDSDNIDSYIKNIDYTPKEFTFKKDLFRDLLNECK